MRIVERDIETIRTKVDAILSSTAGRHALDRPCHPGDVTVGGLGGVVLTKL